MVSCDGNPIAVAVERSLAGAKVSTLEDRGVWGRHIFRAVLADGRAVFVKVCAHPDWGDDVCEKEAYLCGLLSGHGLPAPRIHALDTTGKLIPAAFVVQEEAFGTKLSALLGQVSHAEALVIYRAMGLFFRRLHALGHARSGWIMGAGKVLDMAPNDHMFQAEVVARGKEAVSAGLLDETVYQRLVRLYEKNLAYLKDHRPSLVGSAFRCAIGLTREPDGSWRVSRLMDLADLLIGTPRWIWQRSDILPLASWTRSFGGPSCQPTALRPPRNGCFYICSSAGCPRLSGYTLSRRRWKMDPGGSDAWRLHRSW